MARKALDQLLEGPKAFMQGPAGEAVAYYAGGTQIGERFAFDTQCEILLSWAKQSDLAFAPITSKPLKRMVGPYVLSGHDGSEKVPLHVDESGDFGEIRQQARSILKQHKPESMDALVAAGSERKRSFEQIKATDLYCAAVVQHAAQIGQMPSFHEYLLEVCPKRPTMECAMEADGGGGNGGNGKVGDAAEKVDGE